MRKINVGILISYDYKYLPICLKQIYDYSDRICLAIDRSRLMWSGKKYAFDESFFHWIKQYDKNNKIEIYEDDFTDCSLSAMQNDERERRMIWEKMSDGTPSWHLQIDTDEYFINFKGFVDYLHNLEQEYYGKMSVTCDWITLFKKDINGFIYVDNESSHSRVHIASTDGFRFKPSKGELMIKSPFKILHQSWARSEEEVYQKIKNWGHNSDFDTERYFKFWTTVNVDNYKLIKNFHPLYGPYWKNLQYIDGSVEDTLLQLKKEILLVNLKKDIRKAKIEKILAPIIDNRMVRLVSRIIKHVRKKY